jgi:hypothetical protein
MRLAALSRALAAAFACFVMLSACTVVVEEPRPGSGPSFCPTNFDPVCGRRFGERRTFSNACLANRAGFEIIHRGQCRRADSEQRFCTREYRPVCARRQGQLRTFGNACEADVAGWRVVRTGRC